ncbi:putative ribonucleoprotein [Phaeomoniella chlamydospora]|uniref:Putative ribonucleoprotein n=1 Tax=Phaeomoniella chlamydospora TaxID=158046 RepID=A0A0G2HAC6_PHACM|nr:putative ribonucleoprotein [Phaeomoniella chlamydospora]
MEESPAAGPQRKQFQNYRSQASNNWRMPDSSPRTESSRTPRRTDSDQRNGSSSQGETTNSSRLYVGNLLYTAQKVDVEQLFTANGYNIVNVTMSVDPFTGRNPSYCFVDLESADDAASAMEQLNGQDVLGRAVRINPGVAKKSSDGSTPQGRIRNYERGGSGVRREIASSHENHTPTFDRWSRNDAASHFQAPLDQGKRIYVGGLPRIEPQAVVDAEMQKIFEGFDLQAVSKIISPHPSKADEPGNHYYLFVDLASSEAVTDAIEKFNGMESPWGGELRVNRAKDNRDRKVVREQLGSGGGGGGSSSGASPAAESKVISTKATWRREPRDDY